MEFGILDALTEAYVVCGIDGSVLFANRSVRSLLGLAAQSDVDLVLDGLLDEPESFRTLLAEARQSSGKVPGRLSVRNGARQFRVDAVRIRMKQGPAVLLKIVDAADADAPFDRVNAERRLELETQRQRRARQMLEQSYASLEGFAATAAHDLKAPARKLRLMVDTLSESLGDGHDEIVAQLIERIDTNAGVMLHTIDAIHRFSRAGTDKLNPSECGLAEIVGHVLSVLSVELNESGAEVRTGRLPTVLGDRDFLVLLFQNLLQNAIKFAREAVTPDVAVAASRQSDGSAVVSISDNGIGFTQDQAERLFTPFYRLKVSRADGSGLGLSTCRTIVERHGWLITAEGVPDEGATFQLHIPARDIRADAAPQRGSLSAN